LAQLHWLAIFLDRLGIVGQELKAEYFAVEQHGTVNVADVEIHVRETQSPWHLQISLYLPLQGQ
jgi:hypothetical protein